MNIWITLKNILFMLRPMCQGCWILLLV